MAIVQVISGNGSKTMIRVAAIAATLIGLWAYWNVLPDRTCTIAIRPNSHCLNTLIP
ncbi:MAG: hypothetical protein HFI03_00400 [Lachnospiraceae bacterium]|nr:hypothetical protein [Lachnospiraceae bacterium]